MIFEITRLKEEGRVLERHFCAFRRVGPVEIDLRDYRDEAGNRWMRRARAMQPGSATEHPDIPALLDAQVIHIEPGFMILTGFERITTDFGKLYDYQQSWYCQEVSPGDRSQT